MSEQLQYIEVSKLRPHPDNPRKELGDLTDLVESIKVHGILQNLTVVPDAYEALDEKSYPALIYTGFGDKETLDYFGGYESRDFPSYSNVAQLNAVYDWLISLGYEMSDDEKAMKDGTHEIYKRGENV